MSRAMAPAVIGLAQLRTGAAGPGWPALALAAGVSVAVHLAALSVFAPQDSVAIEGGAEPALSALGQSFADFTQGAQPVTRATALRATPDAATRAATLPQVSSAQAVDRTPPSLPEVADPAALALPSTSAPAQPARTATAPMALQPAQPQPAEAAPPEVRPASAPPSIDVRSADADTPRPRPRPDPTARPPVATQPTPTPPAPAGNAPQAARRGSETGEEAAPAARSGAADTQHAAPGSAAASNYPGEVMRQLQRTRQARVSGRGVAVVAFSVADDGGLASVSVATSSGNAALDQAAMDHVRRATPFPPPPAGAQRQFRFEFASR